MLPSFRDTLRHTSINNDFPAIWASLSLVRLTHKINHRRVLEGGKGKGGAGRRVRKAMTVVQARNCGDWDQSEFSGDRGELMD